MTKNDSLPGFDIDSAMQNLKCDFPTFKKVLLTFYRQRKDNCEEIAAFLSHGDIEHARDIVHVIRGSSGYLGAWRLHDEAAAMQMACESGDMRAVEKKLPAFRSSFREVMDSLEGLENS